MVTMGLNICLKKGLNIDGEIRPGQNLNQLVFKKELRKETDQVDQNDFSSSLPCLHLSWIFLFCRFSLFCVFYFSMQTHTKTIKKSVWRKWMQDARSSRERETKHVVVPTQNRVKHPVPEWRNVLLHKHIIKLRVNNIF